MSTGKTAVLFFSRTLNDEYGAGSFGLNRKGFSKLYKFFVNKTLKTVEEAGLPLIEAYSDQQVGDTFNERLTHSLALVTQKGFERVIIIGNDSPELSVSDIHSADHALDNGQSALGRDARGGVYLIGLDLSKIDSSTLAGIQWHSTSVYDQLSLQLGDVYKLTDKRDINKIEDLRVLLKCTSALSQGVRKFLKLILVSLITVTRGYQLIEHLILQNHLDRGPPHRAH